MGGIRNDGAIISESGGLLFLCNFNQQTFIPSLSTDQELMTDRQIDEIDINMHVYALYMYVYI